MKFAELLKTYRGTMSKSRLASKIGKTPTYIGLIENPETHTEPPPFETCKKIADALSLTSTRRDELYKTAYLERNKDRDFEYLMALNRQTDYYEQMIADMPGAVPAEEIPLLEWNDLPPPTTTTGGIMKYKLIINNNQMEPDFQIGHSIGVIPGNRASEGQYVIAKPKKGDPILRLHKKRNSQPFLLAHNRDFPDINLRENPHEIIGIVKDHWRPLP